VAHEPYVNNPDFGETLDAVEILLKKHEAFERSAATQEERFVALERLTTVSPFCEILQGCYTNAQTRACVVRYLYRQS